MVTVARRDGRIHHGAVASGDELKWIYEELKRIYEELNWTFLHAAQKKLSGIFCKYDGRATTAGSNIGGGGGGAETRTTTTTTST